MTRLRTALVCHLENLGGNTLSSFVGLLVSVTELSALDEGDEDVVRQFKDMMPFYGVELQSHAAVVLGLMLLLFAGIQAWDNLLQRLV